MSEYCFEIPAVRGIQAGRPFYTINAPFGVLQRLVAFDTGNVLARLLCVKFTDTLSDEQRDVARDFWSACAKPILWQAFRYWEESADEFRAGYLSSHGVFLNALGSVGQCLVGLYGTTEKISELVTLNIKRDSEAFVGRCIDAVIGNMLTNATAIKLTAIKVLCHQNCKR